MKIGFIGLGNVGEKLAGSLLRNKFDLTVRDLEENLTKDFTNNGAKVAKSAKELAEKVDLIITCLPSPIICSEVMEAKNGVINGLSKNKIWLEMSTTDESEVKRLGKLVAAKVNLIPINRIGGKESKAGFAITKPKPKKIGTKDATRVSFIFMRLFLILMIIKELLLYSLFKI